MTTEVSNNKRIAKNTLLLYVRTFFTMIVALFTSRVVLNTLGVENYGIYNVVGGVVMMFSVISGSLGSAVSRFITYELGHGDKEKLKSIFSTSVNIQIAVAILAVLLGETLGMWFLNCKMNIPADRLYAANWVLHCSILAFVVNLISVPYNAAIIAHEKMSAFAYVSVIEVVLKLLAVYTIYVSPFDKLITYAIAMLGVSVIVRVIYGIYCGRHFEECKYRFVYDKSLLREMMSFAGWSLFGSGAYMLNVQGVDMLINIFFGVTMNAARGVAVQVQNAVMQFVNNFTVAVNPQITKSYAAGDLEYVYKLVCRGAKFSFFLLLVFVVPIISETEYILTLWLKHYPDYAPLFVRLSLIVSLVMLLGNSMLNAVCATGNIKKYQIWITFWGCWVFPLTWVAYDMGASAYMTYVIYIGVYMFLHFVRLYFAKKLMRFPVKLYVVEALAKPICVAMASFLVPAIIVCNVDSSFARLVLNSVVGFSLTLFLIYEVGLTPQERVVVDKGVLKIKDRILSCC